MSEQGKEHEKKQFHFFVDGNKFDTAQESLTGADIKAIAGVNASYQLFLEEKGDAPDRAVSDAEGFDLNPPPKHFFAVPPATFGR